MPSQNNQKQSIIKFSILLGLVVAYFAYLTHEYDAKTGAVVGLLTWSFFVLCTPIASGGFLIAFPLRLLFGVRMVVTQVWVEIVAILIAIIGIKFFNSYFDNNILMSLYRKILIHPYPYWSVMILSAIGSIISIKFGDELMSLKKGGLQGFRNNNELKYQIIASVSTFLLIFWGYEHVIESLGVKI